MLIIKSMHVISVQSWTYLEINGKTFKLTTGQILSKRIDFTVAWSCPFNYFH